MITRTGSSSIESLISRAGPEAAAALIAIDDAQQARSRARVLRRQAQQDRLRLMRQSAEKLRDMADKALCSSLYRAGLGVVRTFIGRGVDSLQGELRSGTLSNVEARRITAQLGLRKATCGVLEAAQTMDPFKLSSDRDAYEKKRIEIEAERVGHQQEQLHDALADAQRTQSTLLETLQRINEARQQATLQASRL